MRRSRGTLFFYFTTLGKGVNREFKDGIFKNRDVLFSRAK